MAVRRPMLRYMTSALRYDPAAFTKAAGALALRDIAKAQKKALASSMTDRQRELNRRLSFFRCTQYDKRGISWRGNRVLTLGESELVARDGQLPAGYYDPTNRLDDLPYEFRRPATQYALPRLIVNRFTDLLFADGSHPMISIPGDAATQDWMEGLITAAHFWQRWTVARDMGGAMGSVAVGFKFVDGAPVLEVHDPRWCTPNIRDRSTWALDGLEIKYMFPVEAQILDEQKKPQKITIWYWYRRTITADADTTFVPVMVDPDNEPVWVADPAATFPIPWGFCPVRWIQNLPIDDEIDGVPDCDGIWDNVEMLDGLMSQGAIGARANCDPTLYIGTKDQSLEQIRKGTGNALRTEPEGKAQYLEMTGAGIKSALEVRKELRKESLEVAQCVLDSDDDAGGAETATSVVRRYQSMFNRARRFREQYGEMGAKPLIDMMLEASRQLAGTEIRDEVNQVIRKVTVKLPPLVKGAELTDRTPGAGKFFDFKWPKFVEETAVDAQASAQAATTARNGGILDLESAVRFIAGSFKIEDVDGVIQRIRAEEAAKDAALQSELLAGANVPPDPAASKPDAPPVDPLADVTINEITLGIDRLGKLGDVDSLNILRAALARKLGVPYPGPIGPDQLAAAAAPVTVATSTGGAPPGFGGGFGGGAPPPATSTPPAAGAPPVIPGA